MYKLDYRFITANTSLLYEDGKNTSYSFADEEESEWVYDQLPQTLKRYVETFIFGKTLYADMYDAYRALDTIYKIFGNDASISTFSVSRMIKEGSYKHDSPFFITDNVLFYINVAKEEEVVEYLKNKQAKSGLDYFDDDEYDY